MNIFTSSTYNATSALDHIECNLIKYSEEVHLPNTINLTLNSLLLDDFGKPENLIKVIKLLSNISMEVASPSVDLSTIPLTLKVRRNLVPNLIAASCRANSHLKVLEDNAMANMLKTILSYIILFFTLGHAIVPELRRKDPT